MSNNKIQKFRGLDTDGNRTTTALLPNSALVTMISSDAAAKQAKPAFLEVDDDDQSNEFYDWGLNNRYPTEVRKKLEDSAIALPLIVKAVALIWGDGVRYFKKKIVEGAVIIEFFQDDKIDEFFVNSNIDRFMIEQLMDLKFYGNAFSEFLLTKGNTRVTDLLHLEAEFSRLQVAEESNLIPNLGYSGKFVTDISIQKTDADLIPFISARERNKETIARKSGSKHKFAWQTYFPSPGRQIYAKPPHAALYNENGWLDYESSIPIILNSINNNQLNIKYHIKIPYDYWSKMYPKWDLKNDKQRQAIIDEKLAEMDKWLTGIKNAGKSLITHFAIDPITEKPIPGFEIVVIDSKFKEGDFVPAADHADAKITRALGIDPSLAGLQPAGGKMGAGSGSDKREAFNNSILLTQAESKILFEPLYMVKHFNGWDKDIHFGFSHQFSTTTDKEPNGKEEPTVT